MEIIKELIERKGPGHLFGVAHFFLALQFIKEKGPIGRYELGRLLDLGGGSIRTLVKRLKEAKLISAEGNKGHVLDEAGKRILERINQQLLHMRELENVGELTNGKFNVGCQVRNISDKIGSGIKLRDVAIAVGAKSITSLIYNSKGDLVIPTLGDDYLAKGHPDLLQNLLEKFVFQEGDVLVICAADEEIIAKLGVITAVLSILNP